MLKSNICFITNTCIRKSATTKGSSLDLDLASLVTVELMRLASRSVGQSRAERFAQRVRTKIGSSRSVKNPAGGCAFLQVE